MDYDPSTGMYYDRARWYNPATGKFLTRDPLGFAGGDVNLYRYVGNGPVVNVDPSGLKITTEGSDDFKKKVREDLEELKSGPHGRELVEKMEDDTVHDVVIRQAQEGERDQEIPDNGRAGEGKEGGGAGTQIHYDPYHDHKKNVIDENGSDYCPSYLILAHELGHAEENASGDASTDEGEDKNGKGIPGTTPPSEKNSMKREREIREEHGEADRPWYYPPKGLKRDCPQQEDENPFE